MSRGQEPRLVLRFAVASLLAFVLVGATALFLMVRFAKERAQDAGAFHATFVANSILAPALADVDLTQPVTGRAYDRALRIVEDRILSDGRDVRLKVYRADGMILFSDVRDLVGRRFPEEAGELAEVLEGHVETEISNLDAAENIRERRYDTLLEVYVPLRLDPEGPIVAVAELYQDYAIIQADIDAFTRRFAPVLGVGLLLLYAAILPLAFRASGELRRRNQRLSELLAREQDNVAELRDLNQKKDDFVAAASHELRTPLTSIIGYVSTLRQPGLGDDPAVRAEFLDAAEGQTKRLLRLITNLLSAAHLEEGSRPVVIELVDLSAIARTVISDLPGAASRVRVDIPTGRHAATDRGRITEVLTNLLDNALKYSPEGRPIEMGASTGPDGARLWVTDHGIGIEPADQADIFDRFHQVDQSATRRYGGLGLGLHLSRGLLEDLGGSLELASAPGRGSTFTVILPMIAAPATPRADASNGGRGARTDAPTGVQTPSAS